MPDDAPTNIHHQHFHVHAPGGPQAVVDAIRGRPRDARLDALNTRRRDLAGRLAENMAAQARLRDATQHEAEALRLIGDLGQREIAKMREWASAGATGPAPTIDAAERTRLAADLAQAQLQAEAARAVTADLGEEQGRLSIELQTINAAIDDAAFDALAARHAVEMRNLDAYISATLVPRMARHLALHGLFAEMARSHQAAGREEAARRLFQRAEALTASYVRFDLTPTHGAVVEKIGTWSERYAELISDGAASNVVPLGSAA